MKQKQKSQIIVRVHYPPLLCSQKISDFIEKLTHTGATPHLSGVCHKPVFTENKVVTEGRVTA